MGEPALMASTKIERREAQKSQILGWRIASSIYEREKEKKTQKRCLDKKANKFSTY